MNPLVNELYRRNSVVDTDLISRVNKLDHTDAELMLSIIIYYLKGAEGSRIHEIKVSNLVDYLDDKLSVIEQREEG